MAMMTELIACSHSHVYFHRKRIPENETVLDIRHLPAYTLAPNFRAVGAGAMYDDANSIGQFSDGDMDILEQKPLCIYAGDVNADVINVQYSYLTPVALASLL